MRLIDADALKEHLFVGADYDKVIDDGIAKTEEEVFAFQCGWNDALKSVAEFAPTVDPVKHGHWVEVQRIHETDHMAICECSLCGNTVWVYDGQRAWNYCPNCGAYMGVVKHETC